MDPVTAFVALSAASSVVGAVGQYSAAMDEEANLRLQAQMAETQALQKDTIARDELLRAESATRAARGANGLDPFTPNAAVLFKTRRDASDRDRLIERANDRQRAANYIAAAKSAKSRARWSLATGLVSAAVPIAQGVMYKKRTG